MDLRMGRVTSVSPLAVVLNGDTTATAAEASQGMTASLNQEVGVVTVSGRRLIVWAAA